MTTHQYHATLLRDARISFVLYGVPVKTAPGVTILRISPGHAANDTQEKQ